MIDWNYYFTYESDTGDLIWRGTPSKSGAARQFMAGRIAGSRNGEGYIHVQVEGKKYKAHRVIWEMHNGPIPPKYEIDHLDHSKDNNKIGNLRLVTHQENLRNTKLSKNNTSGINGVQYDSATSLWVAKAKHHGKAISIGYFKRKTDAAAARAKFDRDHGFHERHGQ